MSWEQVIGGSTMELFPNNTQLKALERFKTIFLPNSLIILKNNDKNTKTNPTLHSFCTYVDKVFSSEKHDDSRVSS